MLIYQYLNCKIQQNHYIENIDKYLTTIEDNSVVTQEINAPKAFMSDEDSFTIRVEVKDKSKFDSLNYVKLFNDKTDTTESISRYYFVVAKNYINENVYDLVLNLDVANTYQNLMLNSNNFKQVKINRKHKNRFVRESGTNRFYRKFDKVDEGLGSMPMEIEQVKSIAKASNPAYIVTKSINNESSTSGSISLVNQVFFEESTRRFAKTNERTDITLSGNDFRSIILYCDNAYDFAYCYADFYGQKGFYVYTNAVMLQEYIVGNNFYTYYYLGYYSNNKFCITSKEKISSTANAELRLQQMKATGSFKVSYNTGVALKDITDPFEVGSSYTLSDLLASNYTTVNSTVSSIQIDIPSINTINKVDSNIKSIISLPCDMPTYSFCYLNSELTNVVPNNNLVTNNGYINVSNDLYLDDELLVSMPVMNRDATYESKLYGSYVRNHQLAYDSFALPIQYEYVDEKSIFLQYNIYKPIDMSNDVAIQISNIKQQEYLSNTLTCTRNNNIPVYTNEYLEYIRNGYNYDLKSQSINNLKNAIGVVNNVVGTGLNVGAKASMGSLGAFGAIQSGVNALNSLSNSIISGIENDRALMQKRLNLMATSPTMSGSDNYLLFKQLNDGNCFKYITSKPDDNTYESIYNLFYYTGYAENLYFDSMPEIKTRQYFNYIQAEILNCVIVNPKVKARIVQSFANGVTYEWNYNDTWLMNGELYENWETSL